MNKVFNVDELEFIGPAGILVRPLEYDSDALVNDKGVIMAPFSNVPREGKVGFALNELRYTTVAEVLAISTHARKQLDEYGASIVPGDIVLLKSSALNDANMFYLDRSRPHDEPSNLYLIPPQLIEAKVSKHEEKSKKRPNGKSSRKC